MGRPGLSHNFKFRRLSRTLDPLFSGMGCLAARGCLELIWDTAYEAGNDILGNVDDVESAAEWKGERGVLLAALLGAGGDMGAGFLEEASPGVYRVHDLYDHAPEYVRKRLDREMARRESGTTISQLRADAARKALASKREQTAPFAAACSANGTTPAPAPSPAPSPSPSPAPAPESNGASFLTIEAPKQKRRKSATEQMPFTVEQAMRALADGGAVVAAAPSRLCPSLTSLIRQHPDLELWRLVGQWLPVSTETRRGLRDARNVVADFTLWVGHARAWEAAGRPSEPSQGQGRNRGPDKVMNPASAAKLAKAF